MDTFKKARKLTPERRWGWTRILAELSCQPRSKVCVCVSRSGLSDSCDPMDCSLPGSPIPVLTFASRDQGSCVQISQEVGQVVWYSHLFQNFPQYIVIHTVKGFGIVNKAEIDVFLEFSCLFDDPAGT